MSIYKTAIIGCGRIGSEFGDFSHAGAYSIHPQTRLVAVCDMDSGKLAEAQKKWAVPSSYHDYRDMFKKEHIDIISICTPPSTHQKIFDYAMQFPIKAIYCEKPISDKVTNGAKMVARSKKNKKLLVINHQRRFDPFYRELKAKIARREIGRIQQVNCYYTRGIYNTGTHVIDLFCFLFGQPEWVFAVKSENASPFKKDPNLDGMIKFKNGPIANMKACDDTHHLILEIDIIGTKGRIRLGSESECFKIVSAKNLLKRKQLTKIKKTIFKSKYGSPSLTNGVAHIVRCIEGKEKPLSSGSDALSALKVIEAMIASAKKKQTKYIF